MSGLRSPEGEARGAPGELAILTDLVRTEIAARELERHLSRLSRSGRVGPMVPAGDARIAMIGAARATEPRDFVLGTARDLPAALVRGARFELVHRQAFGAQGDPTRGRGVPGALVSAALGVALSASSASAHLVHAVGFGQAARARRADRVALALFGTAAQRQSDLHAAFNLAPLRRAQVVFVARGPLAGDVPMDEAAEAWGLRAVRVPGDDGLAVYQAVREARARAVAGEGPTVIEARLQGAAQPRDARALEAAGGWSAEVARELPMRIAQALVAGQRAAEVAGTPPAESLTEHVFASHLAALARPPAGAEPPGPAANLTE